jgi:hypothetical protein
MDYINLTADAVSAICAIIANFVLAVRDHSRVATLLAHEGLAVAFSATISESLGSG